MGRMKHSFAIVALLMSLVGLAVLWIFGRVRGKE